jgi:hypothetical protein
MIPGSSRERLLWHLPIIICSVYLVVYALDLSPDEPGTGNHAGGWGRLTNLVNFMMLALAQILVWLYLSGRRWGKRRTFAGSAAVIVLLVSGRILGRQIGLRGTHREVVLASPALYEPLSKNFVFAVAPDEHWLVYAWRTSPANEDLEETTEIVVRDLIGGTERVVDLDSASGERSSGLAKSITWTFNEAHWLDGKVRFRLGSGGWIEIELDTGRSRQLGAREVTPVRPPAGEVQALAAKRLSEAEGRERHTTQVAVAWDGKTFGRYVYLIQNFDNRWHEIGTIRRYAPDGRWRCLTVRRELFADWSLYDPVVSPDERFIACMGIRDLHTNLLLQIMIPILGFSPLWREYLLVHDTQTHGNYELGEVDGLSSVQWSGDSRCLYYVDRSGSAVWRIHAVRFACQPSPPDTSRTPWHPPGWRDPDSGPYRGWSHGAVAGVSFRYPGKLLTSLATHQALKLEHTVELPQRDPCTGGGEQTRLTDFQLTISVVEKNIRELVSLDGYRMRMVPGQGYSVLTESVHVAEGEPDCAVERWYHALKGDRTLIISRALPRVSAEDHPQQQAERALAARSAADWERVFQQIVSSIEDPD